MVRQPSRKLTAMWAIRRVLRSMPAAVAAAGLVRALFLSALADEGISRDLVIAQASTEPMDGSIKPKSSPPPLGPVPPPPQSQAPPPLNLPAKAPPPLNLPPSSSPKADYIPPSLAPTPPPQEPGASANSLWGAIGFTADGSFLQPGRWSQRPKPKPKLPRNARAWDAGVVRSSAFPAMSAPPLRPSSATMDGGTGNFPSLGAATPFRRPRMAR
jgi:hypothetical protein